MPTSGSPSVRWVTGLPLPSPAAAGGFGIEVAFDDDTGTFVTVGDEHRYARVLLARIAGGLTEHRGLLALEVQRDVVRAQAGLVVGNRDLDLRWQRERVRRHELSGGGAATLVVEGPEAGGIDPVALDRKTGRLFRVAAPGSWQPLRTCRDDAMLRGARLEPWSTSNVRYLRDASDRTGTFYTAATESAAGWDGAQVRSRHDLFRDLVKAFSAAPPSEKASLAARWPDLASVLADLAVDEVEARIVPFAFYEAFVFATELHELHFDEYCDLAGGAPFATAVPIAGSIGRALATKGLEARLAETQQWLTVPWTGGNDVATLAGDARQVRRLATEAAFLKLHAFGVACRGIAAYHAQFGEPHLGVAAENLMLRANGSPNSATPVRWCFEAAWADVCASMPRPLDGRGQELAAGMCLPALDGGRIYHSPDLADAAGVIEVALRVNAAPLREGEATVGLRCELAASKDKLRGVNLGDVARIVPDAPLPTLGSLPLLATVTAVQRQGAVLEFRPDRGAATPLPGAPFAFAATVTFHRRLRPSADMFSLGMLLARALLVNDERDLFAVREVWDRLLDRLDLMVAGATGVEGSKVAATIRGLLDSERAQLDSASVLFHKELRASTSSPLPAGIWRELLLTIAKLLTSYDGFSWTGRRAQPGDANDPMQQLLAQVDSLLAALRIELTEQNSRREEIASIAEAMLAELDAAGRTGGPA